MAKLEKHTFYLETTVPNYVFNNVYPDRQHTAKKVFMAVKKGKINAFISQVVADELDASEEPRKSELSEIIRGVRILPITKEVDDLARRYIKEEIFPKGKLADATHVAVASVNQIDYLLSWNFKHIVRIKTKEKVAGINKLLGYKTPEIVIPEEIIFDV